MFKAAPVVAAYENLLTKGHLLPNQAQAALVHHLGRLQHALQLRGWSKWRDKSQFRRQGIYIHGGVATGKSRIADLFAATLPQTVSRRRIHFHEFMVDVHTRLHRARSNPNYQGDPLVQIGQQICSESSVLCFDEFQVSDIADAMILKRLFGSFWDAGGIMVSTSNRHPTDLYLNGLNRSLFVPFIAQLQEKCLVWKVDGEHDYRLVDDDSDKDGKTHNRVQVFYTDPAAFQNSFEISAKDHSLGMVPIPVAMNRSITVKAALDALEQVAKKDGSTRTVVSATFAELCEASRGSSDYHAVCRFAHTIYLRGLRSFEADELDIVRRLITLVDIAYEFRTRLICLSTAPLTDVFKMVGVSASPVAEDDRRTRFGQETSGQPHHIASRDLSVKREGGSSSSMMSTFIGEVEWSATGLAKVSLAIGGAGETDVRFAVARAISRLSEMSSTHYGKADE